MTTMRLDKSPKQIQDDMKVNLEVLHALIEGLNGKPFKWGKTEGYYNIKRAHKMGYTLKSKSALAKVGIELKRNVQPVGSVYYGAPLSFYGDLYLVECQCRLRRGDLELG